MYSERAVESTSKSPVALYQRPGLKPFTTVGTGPIRGVHTMDGVPFIVSGTNVYTFNSAGVVTDLGTIGGTDFVDMADNGFEVAIVSSDKGFIATTSTVTQITDVDFRIPSSVSFQDGYFIFSEKDTAVIFRSEALDGFSYNGLNFATAEYDSDDLRRVFSDRDELWAIGLNTLEFWYNDGSTALSFTPTQGKVYETGCLARDTVKKIDNSILWLGSDDRGGRIVWRAGGGAPARVSTHAIEMKLDEATNPEDAYALTFTIEGHSFYVLTFSDFITFVYDVSTGFWSEWQTWDKSDWSPIGFTNAYNSRFVGNRRGNEIYELDLDTFTDDSTKFAKEGISQSVATDDQSLGRHNFFRLDVESGVGSDTDAFIQLSWADEDGTKFNNPKARSLGKIGETKKRAFWRRLGVSRSRAYKFRCTEDVKLVIKSAYLDAQPGIWS
tara:strand:- start:76 stop:1395 length:1320 start_codon:yes stop_codon:yes gene_type:complete